VTGSRKEDIIHWVDINRGAKVSKIKMVGRKKGQKKL